ncbi:spore coat associated protein CotJA [Paenibacillus sp. MWE-103]|uniref:Spore coat associated protein CotJA n=1 Tax=Paenibacillus artemisiicola TaxID=1172618 RepID=A0ABS3WAE7_9BACL|nr:spore coat associated protein CotJA [Paenibacillus artemisiicola]MBO7745297.1 spore coat associated protein CotJA [Paenibacillus artemisiicola]
MNAVNPTRDWYPFVGPCDPCPPKYVKTYYVPPNQYIPYQPMNLPQFPLPEALRRGTLWPALYGPYESKCQTGRPEESEQH